MEPFVVRVYGVVGGRVFDQRGEGEDGGVGLEGREPVGGGPNHDASL